MVAKHVNKKTRKHVNACCSCCPPPLPPPPLSAVVFYCTFNNDAKPPPKWIFREFDVSWIQTPARRVTPPYWTFTWQNLTPAERIYPVWQTGLPALTGQPTYHVNVIKWIWEITWTGGLPHLSGVPHLLGVPHLHVNRPLVKNMPDVSTLLLCRFWSRYLFSWWRAGPRVLQKT